MKRLAFLFIALATVLVANAAIVTGQVTDAQGEPLIGVSVVQTGTSNGTITDFDGFYSIDIPNDAQLQFSYIGYATATESINNRSTINVVLREDTRVLEEVVVVGYGTQRKANLTGAVGSISVEDQLEGRPIANVGTGMQGAVAGLTVTNSSGRIGDSPKFRIRGAVGTLLNESGSQPLILVDGVEISDISMINADDIKEISVLKDAASSSIYGTRAAFGVILITTKSGSGVESKFNVNYSNNFSWATPTTLPELATSYVGAQMALDAKSRMQPVDMFQNTAGLIWTQETIEKMKEWEQLFGNKNLGPEMELGRDFDIISGVPYFYRSWNAADEFIKDFSFSQQHNVSFSGTSGKTNYYLGLSYMGQGGVVKVNPDSYKRYSINYSTDTEIKPWLKVRSKALYTRTNLETPFNFGSSTYDALYYLYRWPVTMPYGTYEGHPFRNSVTETAAANMDSNIKDYMRFSVGATFVLGTPDLTLDVDYTYNLDNQSKTQRGGTVGGWNFWNNSMDLVDNWAASSKMKVDKYQWNRQYHAGNAVLRYKHTWNDAHAFSAFAGMNIEYKEIDYFNAEKQGLLDQTKPEISLSIGDNFIYGEHTSWAIMGFFARINYAYKNRYLIELNGRFDGSSRFPTDQQWGFFPSGSLGWVASEENFWEVLKPYWSFMKIRASYGSIGNQDIGNNRFRAIMTSSNSGWLIGTTNVLTFSMPTALAEGFTWETIKTMNLGVDARFFDNDLGFSFDAYRRINDGMVVGGSEVPSTFGTSAPYENAAQLTTNGWELGIDYHHRFSNGLHLTVSANIADALTTVTKHPRGTGSVIDGSNYEGKIVGEIWGFTTDRLFQESDFDAEGNLLDGIATQEYFEKSSGYYKYGPGDVKYVDLDGNGEITWGDKTVDNHGDWSRIGNSTPRYEYNFKIGLDWHGVDLNIFFQGVGSRQYWATGNMMIPGWFYNEGTYYAHQTDYWTPENTDAYYPRLAAYSQPGQYSAASFNFLCQTRYLLDMSYLRLKNITLGYSLPSKVLKKMHFDKFRVYFSAENVCELDKLGDLPIDPETETSSGDGGAMGFGRIYPFTRQLSCGLQISL
jgi:TonB-linked SusC/RagA family outer membrane protein